MATTVVQPVTTTWLRVAALRLARQHLLQRAPRERIVDVVREMVGLQAQVTSAAELPILTGAYHAGVELDEFMQRSNARARRGRRFARLIFAEAITLVALLAIAALMLGAASSTMGREPEPWAFMPGVVGLMIGLAWMWRILRADPEPDTSAWRYRDS